ncbi:MAG: DUF362 domain-containing protein [Candidatus Hodarchaeaceae archaeon]|nr:DUF362 domain-containing protein [Candidatus Hodarchaeaceae archaeon]
MIATSAGSGRYEDIVTALGRLKRKPSKRLLLKPNLVGGGLAATHVDAVRAVLDSMDVDLIAEGSSVDTFGLYSMLGYRKLAQEYGVDLVDINRTDEWREIEFTAIDARKVKVRVSEFSRKWNVISLALPKTHDHAIVTLTLKNMLGFVHPQDRGLVHGYAATFGKLMRIAPLRKVAARLSRFRSLRRLYSSTEVEERAYLLGARVVHKNIVARSSSRCRSSA